MERGRAHRTADGNLESPNLESAQSRHRRSIKTYVLTSLILLAVILTASLPLFKDKGVLAAELALKGVGSRVGSKTMIRWVFAPGASLDAAHRDAEGVLALRTKGPRIVFTRMHDSGLFLNESGTGEDLVGQDTLLPDGREPRTVGAWIKTKSRTQPAIFNYGTEAPRQRFSLLVSLAGKLMFAGVGEDFEGATTVNDGNWHLALITYDGKTVRLYVDGELDGSRVSDQSTVLNGSFEVGSVRGEFAFFSGMIHSVFLCDCVLSTADIQTLARSRSSD